MTTTLLILALVFGMAGLCAGFMIGLQLGKEEGEHTHYLRERKAYWDGHDAGADGAFDLIFPSEVTPMPTRRRKPGINHSAALAMQSAPISNQ